MLRNFLPILLTAALTFAAGGVVHAQDQAMTGEQIKSGWAGKKVSGRSTTGGPVDLYIKADGTAQVSVGNTTDSGTWRPTETGYCAKWQKIRAGEERCFNVVNRAGKVLVLNADGSIGTEILKVTD